MTSPWTRSHVENIDGRPCRTRVLSPSQTVPVLKDFYLWDLWPIRRADGSVPQFGGSEYWMALSASRQLAAPARHDVARIRLLRRAGERWSDHGLVFPDGASPGSREWAGSAVLDSSGRRVTVRYTAAGFRHRPVPSFAQRLFETSSDFIPGGAVAFPDWSEHREMVVQGGPYRSTVAQTTGEAGFIKAFRDPYVFIDPQDRREHLLFTASLAASKTDFDAAVGHATRESAAGDWEVHEPLLSADGVNNEMERPHLVHHAGHYYLFFSTQVRTFHPDVSGPTGLYGFVAESMDDQWRPLNGTGLVLCNPVEEPYQGYSWLVLNDLQVVSFVDMFGLGGRDPDDPDAFEAGWAPFGGTPAPIDRIALDSDRARVISDA